MSKGTGISNLKPGDGRSSPRFHGMQRVDSEEPLRLRIRRRNVLEAIPGDPDNCIIALAAKSEGRILWARIGGRVSYIVFKTDPTVAVRYYTAYDSLGITRYFDAAPEEMRRNPQILTGKIIVLNPPPPTAILGSGVGQKGKRPAGKGIQRNRVYHAPAVCETRHMTFHSDWN